VVQVRSGLEDLYRSQKTYVWLLDKPQGEIILSNNNSTLQVGSTDQPFLVLKKGKCLLRSKAKPICEKSRDASIKQIE
jgi:hypothetical protein